MGIENQSIHLAICTMKLKRHCMVYVNQYNPSCNMHHGTLRHCMVFEKKTTAQCASCNPRGIVWPLRIKVDHLEICYMKPKRKCMGYVKQSRPSCYICTKIKVNYLAICRSNCMVYENQSKTILQYAS